MSECRIKAGRFPCSNINMNSYPYEYTPTELSNGGMLLYIDKNLGYRLRSDLTLYKSKATESSFIKLLNQKRKTQL